jgi:hypothetical protein
MYVAPHSNVVVARKITDAPSAAMTRERTMCGLRRATPGAHSPTHNFGASGGVVLLCD